MNVMPIAAPPPSPTGSPAPSGEGSAFADVMDQHLGQPRLSWEAANAVLDEVASPTVAPSDGLAAFLAALVGTAGSAPAAVAPGTAAGAEAAVVPAEAAPAGGPGAESTAAPGAPGASRLVVGTAPAGGALEAGAVVGQPGTSPATVGAVAPRGAVMAPGDGLPGAAGGVNRGSAPNAAASTGPGAAPSGTGGSVGTGAGASVDTAPWSQPGSTQEGASSAEAPAALVEVYAGGTGAVDGSADGHGATTGSDRTSLPAAGGPTGVTSAAAAITTGDVADGAPGAAVTDQVFDHVTRLVSRGDGTHRLMLKLHPADLGEVQIVLTVKDGTVDVTLAAGAAAREALREGSPQLRALLEMTGATSGHVVVRELATSGVTGAAQQHAAGSGSEQRQAGSHTGADQASADGPGDLDDAAGGGEAAGGGDGRAAGGSAGGPSGPAGRGADPTSATAESAARRTSPDAASAVPPSASRVDLNL